MTTPPHRLSYLRHPALGNATTYTYSDMGDVASITDGNNNTTSYQYDNLHRLTQVTYPSVGNGQKTKTTTWGCCGKTQETDENGVVTKYYYEEDKSPPCTIIGSGKWCRITVRARLTTPPNTRMTR